jgi:hypothetical protein
MSTEPMGERPRAEEQAGPVVPQAPETAPRPAPPRPAARQPAPPAVVQPGQPGQGRQPAAPAEEAQWAQLQAQFVDDPVGAVKTASGLVEEAMQRLVWRPDGGDTDTEALRAAFLRYRDLHRTLTSLPG